MVKTAFVRITTCEHFGLETTLIIKEEVNVDVIIRSFEGRHEGHWQIDKFALT
jgi:hypothetical protein